MSEQWPYRFELIPLDQLFVDKAYQRPLTNFYKRIVNDYEPAMIGTLQVSQRKNRGKVSRYAIIDGQTRWKGLNELGEPVAPCVVYESMTQAREAELFARLQRERRGMATYLRFRAALIAKDTEAGAIAALVRHAGYKMAGDEDDQGIRSISAVEWIYRKDPTLLTTTLAVIDRAWPMPNGGSMVYGDRVRGEILRGIARFIRDEEPDLARLTDKLGKITPTQLRTRANALREGSGSSGNWDMHVRDALVGVYGGRRR
jgi:hypothetical protein